MNSSEAKVCYSRDDIIGILRDLESIVVSLDHIEAASRDVDFEDGAGWLRDYVTAWGVFEKLASGRALLSNVFSRDPGRDGMDELEREVHDVPAWTSSRHDPPVEG